jgi:hypothetical protein
VDYLEVLKIYSTDIAHYLGVTADELDLAVCQYNDERGG